MPARHTGALELAKERAENVGRHHFSAKASDDQDSPGIRVSRSVNFY
jgi:hypothetical protein